MHLRNGKILGAGTRQVGREMRTTDYESESKLGKRAGETPIPATERNITKKLGRQLAERTLAPSADWVTPLQSPDVISKSRDHLWQTTSGYPNLRLPLGVGRT